MVNGTFTAIQGIFALFRDEAYWVSDAPRQGAHVHITRGVDPLILGILVTISADLLLQGSTFAGWSPRPRRVR